jgi:hypothetical protein
MIGMRVLATVLFLALAGPAAAAEPALVGKQRGDGPVRFLKPDLSVKRGSPKLPADTAYTVLSPSGGRFVAVGRSRTVSIRSSRTGRVRRTLRVPSGRLSWPDADHLLALTTLAGEDRDRNVAHSLDLRTGRVRTRAFTGYLVGSDQVGETQRLLLARKESFRLESFFVADVSPAAGISRTEVTLPDDLAQGNTIMSGTYLQVNGDLILAQRGGYQPPSGYEPCRYYLERIGEAPTPIDLPTQYTETPGGRSCYATYAFVGADFLSNTFSGDLVRLDRDALTVERAVKVPIPYLQMTAYGGGVIAGFGRYHYDAKLDLVSANRTAADDVVPSVIAGGRLYGLRTGCRPLVRIARAPGGANLGYRRGRYKIGVLGQQLFQNGLGEYPDEC